MEKYRGYNNEVFRRMNGYWLKVSPWKNQEERRVLDSYFHGTYYPITTKQIHTILNNLFNKHEDCWWYKGSFYKTKVNDTLADTTPEPHVFNGFTFYLVYRHGDLYWAEPTETKKYRLYTYDGVTPPLHYIGYYTAKGLKPIYKLSKEWKAI